MESQSKSHLKDDRWDENTLFFSLVMRRERFGAGGIDIPIYSLLIWGAKELLRVSQPSNKLCFFASCHYAIWMGSELSIDETLRKQSWKRPWITSWKSQLRKNPWNSQLWISSANQWISSTNINWKLLTIDGFETVRDINRSRDIRLATRLDCFVIAKHGTATKDKAHPPVTPPLKCDPNDLWKVLYWDVAARGKNRVV